MTGQPQIRLSKAKQTGYAPDVQKRGGVLPEKKKKPGMQSLRMTANFVISKLDNCQKNNSLAINVWHAIAEDNFRFLSGGLSCSSLDRPSAARTTVWRREKAERVGCLRLDGGTV